MLTLLNKIYKSARPLIPPIIISAIIYLIASSADKFSTSDSTDISYIEKRLYQANQEYTSSSTSLTISSLPDIKAAADANSDFNERLDGAYHVAIYSGKFFQYFSTPEQFQNELLPAAEAGNPKAEALVGYIYSRGCLATRNGELALYWLKKAVEDGQDKFSLEIIKIYYEGELVPQDCQKAIDWALRLATEGDPQLQTLIGCIYFSGIGNVKKDYKKAFKWLKLAADQGIPEAQTLLGGMYLHGLYISKDRQQARELFTKSAAQNYPGAYLFLGIIYEKGWGVDKNMPKAIEYYKQAAALGNKESKTHLKELNIIK